MIYGKRVRFRAIEKEDLAKFVKWMNDPDVREGLSIHLPISFDEEEEWYKIILGKKKEERPFVIEIQQDVVWEAIGNCGFHEIDWLYRNAEVGIVIGEKQFWDLGFGTEAMHLLCKVGFEMLNLHRIMLRVLSDNTRAIKAYGKVGFVHEGTLREANYKNGKYLDMHIMSMLRSEWQMMEVEHGEA